MATKTIGAIVGLFLLAVWIAGLSLHAQPWITWLNLVAGIIVLGFAGTSTRRGAGVSLQLPIAVAIGLFLMWIGGLVTHAQSWITWCTFGAACGLVVDAIAGGTTVRRPQPA